MIKTFEQAFLVDEGVRWRNLINALHVRDRIIEKKEQVEWSLSEDYPRPTKEIPRERKSFSIIKLLKFLLP